MADIHIIREHRLDRQTVKDRLQQVAGDLNRAFGIRAAWDGDTARLSGPGIKSGTVRMVGSTVTVDIFLGLLAKPLKGRIEQQILARCDEVLS